jgi:hypothetical protein
MGLDFEKAYLNKNQKYRVISASMNLGYGLLVDEYIDEELYVSTFSFKHKFYRPGKDTNSMGFFYYTLGVGYAFGNSENVVPGIVIPDIGIGFGKETVKSNGKRHAVSFELGVPYTGVTFTF